MKTFILLSTLCLFSFADPIPLKIESSKGISTQTVKIEISVPTKCWKKRTEGVYPADGGEPYVTCEKRLLKDLSTSLSKDPAVLNVFKVQGTDELTKALVDANWVVSPVTFLKASRLERIPDTYDYDAKFEALVMKEFNP